ncbi:MAG: DUF2779 domain-containing protein [Glaciecola sp.]
MSHQNTGATHSNIKPRYLTKSRFKMATECPTKLFYTGKSEYQNMTLDDPFLAALADGGHQVGELAKCYYPEGIDITSLDYDEAEQQTNALLALDKVVIFEPAIRYQNLFIRVDILVKNGNYFELIEVKAKSYDIQKDADFLGNKGRIQAAWKPYLYDVAFQKHVLTNAFPNTQVTCSLMLVDKTAKCPTDALNQKFLLTKNEHNRKGVEVSSDVNSTDLSTKLLTKIKVDKTIDLVYEQELCTGMPAQSFIENINALAAFYETDQKISPCIGAKCKSCEFKCTNAIQSDDKKSGFKECWSEQLKWSEKDFSEPTVLDIWNFRKSDKLIAQNRIKLTDINLHDIGASTASKTSILTSKERQWLQIEKVQQNDHSVYFDAGGMQNEMASWTYPLHFIDFETSAAAIPFHKGMCPYEGLAFQFSHHMVHADGKVEHAGQFLSTDRGEFPNFKFVRALKDELSQDEGSIFMYSAHENSYLNMIYQQLKKSDEADRSELCSFIKSITRSSGSSNESWEGGRAMIDMLKLVKQFYYDPSTNGSNSIKYVLPAILNSSSYLKEKYSKPIYGSDDITSLNFKQKTWVTINANGQVCDPYQQLPKMFKDISSHDVQLLSEGDDINNGGLALTAYARLQFTEMSDYERDEICRALLAYCELDTWAMVALYEGWREMV